ncbi:helicase associated domain-containing protein [Pseudarthrobacter sp. HLT3-5]|uniref:helicase associated domain-containing protein n=1 Tax=Pseudarthrobacter cellobiosi TaxID=2953654 RepID=UPI00208EC901|nr:helicase associated domain-containing protein [Pseudarthrobacter sp. HLT3-5]MCO4276024.1 helicase associated domain-containing protein [Pseudarthrobacter sp. HLT3-5]
MGADVPPGNPVSEDRGRTGVAASTVHYHLYIAAQAEPAIREEHKAATASTSRNLAAGVRNMYDTIAFHKAEGRLPTMGGATARERAMGVWIHRRRQEAVLGTLSPIYRQGVSVIAGWEKPSTRKSDDEARWRQRLAEVTDYRAAGNDWPRHKKTDTEKERVLGVWLHVQRIKHRRNQLDQNKEAQLNTLLPRWRTGRVRGRRAASGHRPPPNRMSRRAAASPISSGVADRYQYVPAGLIWPR